MSTAILRSSLLWNANCWRKFAISYNSGGVNCCGAWVRFWHKADIPVTFGDVRYWG